MKCSSPPESVRVHGKRCAVDKWLRVRSFVSPGPFRVALPRLSGMGVMGRRSLAAGDWASVTRGQLRAGL